MPQLSYKPIKLEMPELGDMKHRIQIYDRTIVAPIDDTGNYSLDFTKKITVWASIKSVIGIVIFDSVNMDKTVSHLMTIRYLPFITQEHWVLYDSRYYDIIKIENLNEQNRFQILHCNLRGITSKASNEA
jgi:hypothetical protein